MELTKKFLAWFFIISLLIYPEFSYAGIANLDYPSPTSAMDEIMGDLGMDKDETKKFIQEDMNVSNYKKNLLPEIKLTLVPTSPSSGKKITAIAAPSYFSGNAKQMYYTWYLKHDDGSGSGTDAAGRKTKNGNTDWNNDDEIDIEDYKIEAMRILAKGDWKPDFASKGILETTEDADNNGYTDDYDAFYASFGGPKNDPDKDGYDSVFGGEDQKGKPEHCYVLDIAAGIPYEIKKGGQETKECTKTGIPSLAEYNQATSGITVAAPFIEPLKKLCENFESMGYDCCPQKTGSTGTYLDLVNIDGKTWDALEYEAHQRWNPIGLIPLEHQPSSRETCAEGCGTTGRSNNCKKKIHEDEENTLTHPSFPSTNPPGGIISNQVQSEPLNISPGDRGEATIEFSPLASASAPGQISKMDLYLYPKGPDNCKLHPEAQAANFWLFYVFDGQWQGVKHDMLSWDSAKLKRDVYIDDGSFKIPKDWIWNHCNEDKGVNVYTPPIGENLYFALTDQNCDGSSNQRRSAFGQFTWDFTARIKEDATESTPDCKHLFPKKYYIDKDKVKIFKEGGKDLLIGDPDEKKFTNAEEKFWGTDPEEKDTNNDGIPDEQALAGLGAMELEWIYRTGDQVGVAIEGVTDNTPYKDSSLKTVWALPENVFSGDDNCKINPSTETVKVGENLTEINITTGTDLNDCLKDNFFDPAEGTKDRKIEVTLSYSPQNPINDPKGNNSDELSIRADFSNVENKSFMQYDWSFWLCDEGESACQTQTLPMLSNAFKLNRITGIGLDTVKLKLASSSPKKYLKAELNVKESAAGSSGKSGKGQIIIPLQNSSASIVARKISLTGPDLETSGTDVIVEQTTDERCDDPQIICDKKAIAVAKNEIIGLYFKGGDNNSVISWSLDGKPLATNENNRRTSALNESAIAYFPVIRDTGHVYSVRLDLTDKQDSQTKTTLIQDFKVEDPLIAIKPSCDESEAECPVSRVVLGELRNPLNRAQKTADVFSQDLFRAEKNSIVTIEPKFNFDPLMLWEYEDGSNGKIWKIWKIEWVVDGKKIDPLLTAATADSKPYIDNDTGNLILAVRKDPGDKYSISAKTFYTQPALVKRALGNIWNVPDATFIESNIEDYVEIEVTDPLLETRAGPGKILASLFAGMPEYLNFLFRIFLTLGLILFISNLSLAMFPKSRD